MLAVTILGNNSALSMHDRHQTSQVVTADDQLFLVDCGESTQSQMQRYKIKKSKINHIFISHLHGDHYYGLPGLLNTYSLTNRIEALHVYATPALKDVIELQMKVADASFSFEFIFHPITEAGILLELSGITVSCFAVTHRIPCWGFLFKEKEKPRGPDDFSEVVPSPVAVTEKKEPYMEKLAEFLSTLTSSKCLSDISLLMNSECQNCRYFLNKVNDYFVQKHLEYDFSTDFSDDKLSSTALGTNVNLEDGVKEHENYIDGSKRLFKSVDPYIHDDIDTQKRQAEIIGLNKENGTYKWYTISVPLTPDHKQEDIQKIYHKIELLKTDNPKYIFIY
jgi:hypothetical protein